MAKTNLYYIEGSRGSGKTFLAKHLKKEYFKFQFVDWFKDLELENKSKSTHLFALGKEIMLLQLSREALLKSVAIVDRGIISVLVWGITQSRISYKEALEELEHLNKYQLFLNCRFILIEGGNSKQRGKKDLWDNSDSILEKKLFNNIFNYLLTMNDKIIFHRFENEFNNDSLVRFKELIFKLKYNKPYGLKKLLSKKTSI